MEIKKTIVDLHHNNYNTMLFTEGFTYNGIPYGWKNKELWRLPYTNGVGKKYVLKRLELIDVNNTSKGYRIAREKKSITQIVEMTTKIKTKINIIKSADMP